MSENQRCAFFIPDSERQGDDSGMASFLEMQHCQMTFRGLQAVKDFSATVEKGSICGLIGTNGAGKTTVINMLSGTLTPTKGKILLEGKYILGLSDEELAAEFDCSPNSIRMKLTRARRQVIKLVKEGGFSFEPA